MAMSINWRTVPSPFNDSDMADRYATWINIDLVTTLFMAQASVVGRAGDLSTCLAGARWLISVGTSPSGVVSQGGIQRYSGLLEHTADWLRRRGIVSPASSLTGA